MAELTWEGKYRDGKRVAPVRLALPFQTVETVNESAQDRMRTLDLFASGKPTEWRNRLIWGDKKYVLPSLLSEFAGKVNLVYIDPPFNTAADFSFIAEIPGSRASLEKQPSIIEQKAYRDTWGQGLDSYLRWFSETVLLLRELLAEDGSIYVHLDWHIGPYAKAILDEVFGADRFLSGIVWKRTSAHSSADRYGPVHDLIFFYSKGDAYCWNELYQPYDEEYVTTFFEQRDGDGRRWKRGDLTGPGTRTGDSGKSWRGIDVTAKGRHWQPASYVYDKYRKVTGEDLAQYPLLERFDKLDEIGLIHWPDKRDGMPRYKCYLEDMPGIPLQDIWTDIRPIHNLAEERVGYPTQKPEPLLHRIISASSKPDDLVLDCFCGSGTAAAVAEKLGRRWIACDLGRFAIHTARKRLLGIPRVKPFVVQNLGKYERQAWMAAEFERPENRVTAEAAYRRFILDLFHAEPLTGHSWIHGAKAGRLVHVGAVDAPVTLADVKSIVREAWRAAGKSSTQAAVDILGWEFAFELNETAKQAAAESRVDIKFRRIPREVLEKKAVEQGDVQPKDFFELRALSTKITKQKRTVTVELTDFILPSEDLPDEVARSVNHWSQWIDYWAIDWNCRNDTFHNEWQTYRTRDRAELELRTNYQYKEPGEYMIVVKVIDILGNDTTKAIPVEVK